MFFVCFGLACLISALGYWFLAGSGPLHTPTGNIRTFVTGVFGAMSLLSFYGALYLDLSHYEHNQLIPPNTRSPAGGNVYFFSKKR